MQTNPVIHYLRDVLGIRKLMIPEEYEPTILANVEAPNSDSILVVGDLIHSNEIQETTFEKMVKALGFEDVEIFKVKEMHDWEQIPEMLKSHGASMVFGDIPTGVMDHNFGHFTLINGARVLVTYGPKDVRDQEKRQSAWTHMKYFKHEVEN